MQTSWHKHLLKSERLFICVLFIISSIPCTGYAEESATSVTNEPTNLDRSHRYLSNRVLRLAESLNNVISSTLLQEEDPESEMTSRFYGNMLTAYQVEGSHIRVTPRLTMTEGRDNEYKLNFKARLRLADLSKRLRLYADSYDDNDTMDEIFSDRYRQKHADERVEGAVAGLTYFLSDELTRKFRSRPGCVSVLNRRQKSGCVEACANR